MAAPKAVWAIDIGQCAVKALHARLVDDAIEIDNFITIEHEQILSQPDADEPALIRETLKKLVDKTEFGKDAILISVPGHRSFGKFSKLPPVEPKKIPDIVHYEATQQIPFGIDEVVWDYQVFKSDASPEIEVGIFAIKRALVAQYLEYFHELDLHPVTVQTAPMALYNACQYEGLVGSEAHVIADVGAQNTNFLIVEGHRLWVRNIPIGGNDFTESLQKSFKLNFSKAEQLKRTAATSKYARAVFQSMRPVFSDLSAEFQRSIGFYTSVNRESQVQRLYALGNAFRLPGLLKFLQQNVGAPVERVETFSKLKLGSGLNEAEFTENVLTFAVAYGLTIQGLGQAAADTDLMPPEIAREVLWQGKQYWFAGAAACLVAAAAAVWLPLMGIKSAIASDKEENTPKIQRVVTSIEKSKRDLDPYLNPPRSPGEDLARDLAKVSREQLVMPTILQIVSTAATKTGLQPELANASTPDAYAAAAKNIERSQRRQIFVSRIDPQFMPDLTAETIERELAKTRSRVKKTVRKTARGAGRGGMGVPGMGGPMMGMPGEMMPMPPGTRGRGAKRGPQGGGRRAPRGGRRGSWRSGGHGVADPDRPKGFIITIEGRTPYGTMASDTAKFLIDTLVKNLAEYGPQQAEKTKLWIDNVDLPECRRLVVEKPNEHGRAGAPAITGQPTAPTGPQDRVTGEDMSNDWTFVVHCVVHLGEPEEADPDLDTADDRRGGNRRNR